MKRTVFAVLSLATLVPAHILQAQEPRMGGRGAEVRFRGRTEPGIANFAAHWDGDVKDLAYSPELIMRHQAEIGLTDAQRTQISQAIQRTQPKIIDTQWKLSAEEQKMVKLLESETVNEAHALDQVDRILALAREAQRAQMSLVIQIRNALTPEQRKKLRDLVPFPPGNCNAMESKPSFSTSTGDRSGEELTIATKHPCGDITIVKP